MDDYGLTALVFAHEVSGPLTSLVKTLDRQLAEAAARGKKRDQMGVFVVFCSDDAGLAKKLQNLAAKEGLKQVVLCTHKAAGPPKYRLAREADLTVVVYNQDETVTANFPLKSGELDEEKAQAISKAVSKALPR